MKAGSVWVTVAAGVVLGASFAVRAIAQDPYETYVRTSQDFQPVRQDKAFLTRAYPSWTFMPWYYQWTIGFDEAAGQFCRDTGINGAFIDRGKTDNLPWIEKNHLKFYVDHTAGKGDLHIWDQASPEIEMKLKGTGLRERPLNQAMREKLERVIKKNLAGVKSSPMRAAYALDDELSWGHFVKPAMWQITDDPTAYTSWLKEIYGPNAPARTRWISYETIRKMLPSWSVATFDASPLMDQWTFNDSYWNNLIGDLVTYANSIDPDAPCGYVGGQQPSPFGGYDYAKLMRKIQYIEAYNIGNSQAIIRSLNPRNAMPAVTSMFHKKADNSIWQMWYYMAQGNRGHIAWVEKWFDADKKPLPSVVEMGPAIKECAGKIGPLMSGAEWIHNGVALYYNHASIQLGWILDAQPFGGTWMKRNEDSKLGGLPQCRNAWMNMLRDEGLQFNVLSYVDLIQSGVPREYKILILSSTLCLSDVEARRIREFCKSGGTVIADYMPGLWDQHGKGRAQGGALDDLFGVKHSPSLTSKDVFNGNDKLWCETDQNANYQYKSVERLMTNANTCVKEASGFNKAVRGMGIAHVNKVGLGTAILMNLSPQWYNVYRGKGVAEAAKRTVFMKPIHDAGIRRWVELKNAGDREFGYEITCWRQGARTILFLIDNKTVAATDVGGGSAVGLATDTIPVTLAFAKPVSNVRDERTGKELGSGAQFALQWKKNEACVLSFDADK